MEFSLAFLLYLQSIDKDLSMERFISIIASLSTPFPKRRLHCIIYKIRKVIIPMNQSLCTFNELPEIAEKLHIAFDVVESSSGRT